MIDIRGGCVDSFKESGNKPEVVVDEVESWRCLGPT